MSTKTKHTPRPAIELHTPVDGNFLLVNKPSGELFAKTWTLRDARLIAAAPELLEAGIELLSCLDNLTTEQVRHGGDRCFREQLRRVITKTTK